LPGWRKRVLNVKPKDDFIQKANTLCVKVNLPYCREAPGIDATWVNTIT